MGIWNKQNYWKTILNIIIMFVRIGESSEPSGVYGDRATYICIYSIYYHIDVKTFLFQNLERNDMT